MPPMSFLSELMSSSSSSSGPTMASGGVSTHAASMRMIGIPRQTKNEDAPFSDASSEPEKENAKLVSIRELVAKNAAKDRPKLVVMDQTTKHNNSGDDQQTMLNELLSRKMGSGSSTTTTTKSAASGSVTASPASSTSSSSVSTPTTPSQRPLKVPTGGSTALTALNELLSKRQPSQTSTSPSMPTSHRKRRTENPALQALLAQRNSTAAAAPTKSTTTSESRSRAIAELLAKRVTPHPTPDSGENPETDVHKNALAEMLAKRGAAKEPVAQRNPVADMLAKRQAPVESDRADPKTSALAEMLAKRNGGGAPVAKKNTEPKKSNPVADMFAKRAQSQKSTATAGDSRSNALSEMLSKRGGDTGNKSTDAEKSKKSTPNPLAEMLAKRQGAETPPTPSPPANPLAEMLAKRQGGSGVSTKPSNPLADMLAKRQAPAAPANPLAEMMAKRQAGVTPYAPTESVPEKNNAQPGDEDANTPLKDHPKYGTYFKMLKIGLSPDVVKHRMRKEGVDPAILDCDASKPLPKGPAGGDAMDTQDPEFLEALKVYNAKMPKYQQMMKMGLPRGAVEHKMRMEGIDAAWLDGPPQPKKKAALTGPTEAEIAAHREKYKQYFQMLKMGLPRGAVEHKMRMAGVDPKELDGPIVAGGAAPAAPSPPRLPVVKKATSIRKKIHWEVKRQEARDTTRESLWNLPLDEDSDIVPVKISKESKEMLEKLFVKEVSTKPTSASAPGGNGKKDAKQAKKQVMYLIDMKKSQNIAITLARIKLSFPELKREILALNPTVLSTAQLQSLMDMWPDQQEQVAIDNFHGDDSLIGAAEKFLVEVRNIPRFREKLGCLVFKQEFPTRVHELRESINLVIRGVNQVCCSTALQQLFIYILQTGNLLNFGTDESEPASVGGFALNSLVKLSQTKAFTGGITFLQYIVQSIEHDIPQLARYPQQINLIQKCSKVSIASLFSEKRSLEEGLKSLNHEAQAVMPAEADDDAELGASILKHFAAEVEREVDAIQSLLDQLMDSKRRFLEYFEEDDTSEELDVLLSHIARFTSEFEREHAKHLMALEKKRLQEQHRRDQEAKKQQLEKRKLQMAMAPRHSLHENPLHHRRSNQHGHDHGHKRPASVKLRHSVGSRPEGLEQSQSDDESVKSIRGGGARGQHEYFPQFVVDRLQKKSSLSDNSASTSHSGLSSRTSSSQSLELSSSTLAA